MKERDYGSYIEDIIEHMNYADEFIKYMHLKNLQMIKRPFFR